MHNAQGILALAQRSSKTPWLQLLRACTTRILQRDFARSWKAYAVRWCFVFLMGIITGLLFLQLPVSFPVRPLC